MSQDHQLQRQRFELKYFVHEELTAGIRDFLRCHLELDEFCVGQPQNAYSVYSVYLDTTDLRMHQATQNGDKNRFKLRMRYYNDAPELPVFFEIKGRVDNCVLKQRCPVPRELAPMILRGQLPGPDQILTKNPRHYVSLQRFYELMMSHNARPKAHNSYRREAWVSPKNNSVRITFDRHIHLEPFFELKAVAPMAHPLQLYPGDVVFEIKFTERFPNWVKEMVHHFGLRQFAAAKYSAGVAMLGEHRFQNGKHWHALSPQAAAEHSDETFAAAHLPAGAKSAL